MDEIIETKKISRSLYGHFAIALNKVYNKLPQQDKNPKLAKKIGNYMRGELKERDIALYDAERAYWSLPSDDKRKLEEQAHKELVKIIKN